ncbi:MAG: hypothetical protein ABIT04_01780 [Novosphingobium sp.]
MDPIITSVTFTENSVFQTHPLLLDVRQRRYLVGIRFSVQTTMLAARRLVTGLKRWSDCPPEEAAKPTNVELFADAWSIVDNARRLQRLLYNMPGISEYSAVSDFVARWPELKRMRDTMQHLDKDFGKERFADNYVYGTIYWIDSRTRESKNKIYVHTVNAGPQANATLEDFAFPSSIPIDAGEDIHRVVLSVAGSPLRIDDLLADIHNTIVSLDVDLTAATELQFANQTNVSSERKARLELKARTDFSYAIALTPRVQE